VRQASGRRPLRLVPAAAAALGLAVGGCGESREQASSTATTGSPPPPTAAPRSAGFTVTEREYSLSPPSLEVRKAGRFTLSVHNAGTTAHALAIEGRGVDVGTDPIAPGGTAPFDVTLTRAGRYRWYCPIADHRRRGMRGTVVVAQP
jgi:plastocyanin